jgi:hypothetical protein
VVLRRQQMVKWDPHNTVRVHIQVIGLGKQLFGAAAELARAWVDDGAKLEGVDRGSYL